MNKVILYFNDSEIKKDDELLTKFERKNFVIHCFSNVEENDANEIDIEYLCEALNVKDDNLYLMSNNEKIIFTLFKKYSWEYSGFIFENNVNTDYYDLTMNNNYEFNNNLYVINSCNSKLLYNKLSENLNFETTESDFDNLIQSIEECSGNITQEKYDLLLKKGDILSRELLKLERKKQEKLIQYAKEKARDTGLNSLIYIFSFFMKVYKSQSIIKEFLNCILESDILDVDNKLFLIKQIKTTMFQDVIETDEEIERLVGSIYKEVYTQYSDLVGEYEFIPKEYRNKELIFLITPQFLKLEHGPTKTVLDRAYVLQKYLNKNVIIIDTKECLSLGGIKLFYQSSSANVIDYSHVDSVEYKDEKLLYYQTDKMIMPNLDEYKNILNMVQKYKPYMVMGIGDLILANDLCSKIVPTVTVPLGNLLPLGCSTFKSTYSDQIKYNREEIIESIFTFDFKSSTHKYTREEMNLPNDKFLLAIVGGRLQTEIDDDFLQVLDDVCSNNCFVAFIGSYELTDDSKKKYKHLTENSINMGFQSDVLAILEIVDLYVNPKRLGGGTSGLEALYKRKPAVSINYGDVAAVIGKEFCVKDFANMREQIIKYSVDKEFYSDMSKRGVKRAKDLMNSKKHFIDLYNKIVNNKLFK